MSGCLGPPNVSPHWESVIRRTLCLRASSSPPSNQNKPHSFSLILLANVQNGWVASTRKHICILIRHQGIFLTFSALIWRRCTDGRSFRQHVYKWGCSLGAGRPVRIVHLYSMTAPNWLSFCVCQQGQCPSGSPSVNPGGHQAPDVSPRRCL